MRKVNCKKQTPTAGIRKSLESGKSAAVEMLEPHSPLRNFSRENLMDDPADETGFALNEPELQILEAFLHIKCTN
jgi:hypothetical protein